MKYSIDIFQLLNAISTSDIDFIDSLSEEELKEFNPVVIQMWLSKPSDFVNERMYYMNQMLNEHIFQIKDHKKLLGYIMCVCQGFGKTKYNFPKKRQGNKFTTSIKIISEYYDVRKDVAELYLKSLDKSNVMDLAIQLGYESKVISQLDREFLQ